MSWRTTASKLSCISLSVVISVRFKVDAAFDVGVIADNADLAVLRLNVVFGLFGISRGKATYGGTPTRQIGDSPRGRGKGVGIES